MIRLRLGSCFACVLVVGALSGCGDRHARILNPAPRADVAIAPSAPSPLAAHELTRGLIPPTVRITCPVPSPFVARPTPPALRILWEGTDPDGVFTDEPVQYRYILLGPSSEFPPAVAIADPDSLRRYYLEREWGGWTSVSAETTSVQFRNLIPDAEYVFAVIAFDESGLYSPVFSLSGNLLRFHVTYAGYPGPRLTIVGPGFGHEFTGYDPGAFVAVEIEEGREVPLSWLAQAGGTCQGVDIRSYRWVLDPADLNDETPRTDEETDLSHWSAPSLESMSATLGPFQLPNPPEPDVHMFFAEVTDIVGFRTLGAVRITVTPLSNRPPDCSRATAALAEHGPPDGSMVPVTISGVTDPDGDPITITVTGVTQDEAVEGGGAGQTCPDAALEGSAARVRRERSGYGDGRVYTISFTADDGRGGTSGCSVDVCIPHDNGRGRSCVKSDLQVNSLGPCRGLEHAGDRGSSAPYTGSRPWRPIRER